MKNGNNTQTYCVPMATNTESTNFTALAKLERHPLSACFPELPEDEKRALRESIIKDGLVQPIVLHEGKVLDGWNRLQACLSAKQPYKIVEFTEKYPDIAPETFVITQNAQRRHLTTSQKVISVVRTCALGTRGSNQHSKNGEMTTKEIMELTGASKTSIDQAKRIVYKGCDGLIDAVANGTCSLKKADDIVAQCDKASQMNALENSAKQAGSETQEIKLNRILKQLAKVLDVPVEQVSKHFLKLTKTNKEASC